MTILSKLTSKLTLIAACGLRGELGLKNQLPWHQETDLQFFSDQTKRSTMIMGRLTFESLGKKLPGRTHCILSTTMTSDDPELIIVRNLEEMWQWLDRENIKHAFVIGGSQIYSLLGPYCSKLLITHIHGSVLADAYLDLSLLHKSTLTAQHYVPADANNQFAMTFATYTQEVLSR